jgi:hypothetical protein
VDEGQRLPFGLACPGSSARLQGSIVRREFSPKAAGLSSAGLAVWSAAQAKKFRHVDCVCIGTSAIRTVGIDYIQPDTQRIR